MRGVWGTVVVLAVGCGGGKGANDAGPDASVPLWSSEVFEVGGLGLDGGFVAMAAELTATPGAQGGFHLPITYLVKDQGPTLRVQFDHQVRRARDKTLVSKGSRMFDVGAGAWSPEGGLIIFICPTPVGVNVVDEELSFQVTASRSGVEFGTATARTVFRCPAGDSFCATICSG